MITNIDIILLVLIAVLLVAICLLMRSNKNLKRKMQRAQQNEEEAQRNEQRALECEQTAIRGRVKAEKAEQEARRNKQLETMFLKNVSHAMRTPLTAIIGSSDLLRKDTKGQMEEDERQQLLESIHKNSEKLLGYINKLTTPTA